jgi:hypothetical protein
VPKLIVSAVKRVEFISDVGLYRPVVLRSRSSYCNEEKSDDATCLKEHFPLGMRTSNLSVPQEDNICRF